MKIRRWLARQLFNLANFIDDDCVLDLACDVAMDAGFGYCDDCSPDGWNDESME